MGYAHPASRGLLANEVTLVRVLLPGGGKSVDRAGDRPGVDGSRRLLNLPGPDCNLSGQIPRGSPRVSGALRRNAKLQVRSGTVRGVARSQWLVHNLDCRSPDER